MEKGQGCEGGIHTSPQTSPHKLQYKPYITILSYTFTVMLTCCKV